jgi:hypothetical protein
MRNRGPTKALRLNKPSGGVARQQGSLITMIQG